MNSLPPHMRKYVDNGRRGRAPDTTWYRDFSAEARRFGLRYRVLVEPELYERMYDMLADAGERPDASVLAGHFIVPLMISCRISRDRCRLEYEVMPIDHDRSLEIPMLAEFCTDYFGDCFALQLRRAGKITARGI